MKRSGVVWVVGALFGLAAACSSSDGGSSTGERDGDGDGDGRGDGDDSSGDGDMGGDSGLGGMGGYDGKPLLASCDWREGDMAGLEDRCRDWYGSSSSGVNLAASCNGDYSESQRCPSAGRVGRCQLNPVLGMTPVYNYYTPTWTAQDAEEDCNGGFNDEDHVWLPE